MDYNENVRKVAEEMAEINEPHAYSQFIKKGKTPSYYMKWGACITRKLISARIAVRLQAEAVRTALDINGFTRDAIGRYLIERGLIPASGEHEQPVRNNEEVEPALIILNLLLNNPSVNLGDMGYTVRDNEGKGGDGPDVKAWGEAVAKAKELLNNYPEIPPLGVSKCPHTIRENTSDTTAKCKQCGLEYTGQWYNSPLNEQK